MIVCVVVLFSFPIDLKAQYGYVNKHIIIAFDNSLPEQYKNILVYEKSKIEQTITDVLSGYTLSEEGDFYSLVNFGISANDVNIDNLARPIKDKNGEQIVWRNIPRDFLNIFSRKDWYNMTEIQGFRYIYAKGRPFSLLTGAKSYVLNSVLSLGKSINANKTYLIMITDNYYNGNDDQNKEFDTMQSLNMQKKDFLRKCDAVNKLYNFKFIKSQEISHTGPAAYQALLYEVVPLSVSLNSVVDYPANLGLKRINGGYSIDFKCKSISDMYRIKRLQLTINDKEKFLFKEDKCSEIKIFLSNSEYSDSVKVDMKVWLLQNDSIYNGALLSPYDENFTRLAVSSYHKLKNEAYIFGIIPIPDFLWSFTDNWHLAVIFWDIVTLILIVAFMLYIVTKLIRSKTTFVPTNGDIGIQKKI